MGRLWILCGFLALTANVAVAQGTHGFAFVDATVITMSDAGVLKNHTVLVRGDTILAVGPNASLSVPSGFERVDARGNFLLPGFLDMHVHLSGPADLLGNLRHGVTTVLQMSGQRGAISDFLGLRDQIEAGVVAGPRLFLTGPMFDRIGLRRQTTAYAVQHADSIPALIREHVAAGYDFFKVHNFTPRDVHGALVGSFTLPVVGHIPMRMTIDEVLGSGQVMVAHAQIFYYQTFYDPSCTDGFWQCMAQVQPDLSLLEDLVEKIARSGVAVTANLSVLAVEQSNDDDWQAVLDNLEFEYLDPAMQARWRVDNPGRRTLRAERRRDVDNQVPFMYAFVSKLRDRGVAILAGSDAGVEGVFPGKAIHLELRELVRAGLTPQQALEAATTAPAEFLRKHVPRSRDVGRVVPGFVADLVLLHENPLVNIANTERIRGTMSRGVWRSRSALDQLARNE